MKGQSRSSGTTGSLRWADKDCSRTDISATPDRILGFRLQCCSVTHLQIPYALTCPLMPFNKYLQLEALQNPDTFWSILVIKTKPEPFTHQIHLVVLLSEACKAFVHQKNADTICPWSSFGGFWISPRLRETEGVEVCLSFVCGCFGWSHLNSKRCGELRCVLWLSSVVRGEGEGGKEGGLVGLALFMARKIEVGLHQHVSLLSG